ncbi:immunity 22 family protein [Pasteurella skyensis]|uniref:immunity 22 family protein n=1 Tax=Phocoenobacter skyensis TaxID=97481 RepID=UPI0027918736|nr:immunity 22 family protein [Pasteurella skyensis]MDP8170374.1 immunity 22 family protein [Pasteurella skyensis]
MKPLKNTLLGLLKNQPEFTFHTFDNIINFIDYVEAFASQWVDKIEMNNNVVCVWIGYFSSEEELYDNYLSFNYENEEVSRLCKDTGLDYYDEDFIESWWCETLEINNLLNNKDYLFDSKYFFDELIAKLKELDLAQYNSISFLFGTQDQNENLFAYQGMTMKNAPIQFVFKKEYVK